MSARAYRRREPRIHADVRDRGFLLSVAVEDCGRHDAPTCAAMAADLATPRERLLVLAAAVPESVVANPAFRALLEAAPARALAGASPLAVRALVAQPRAPARLVAWAATQADVELVRRAAGHEKAAPEDLAALAARTDPLRPPAARDWVREAVAGNPGTPVDVLARLASDGDVCVRIRVAENPRAAPFFERLAADEEQDVRATVAHHPATPPDLLAVLATDPADYVRRRVAERADLAPDLRARLAHDESEDVRRAARSRG